MSYFPHNMEFTRINCCIILVLFVQTSLATTQNDATRKNVLMIISDDLRPEIGAFYDAESQLNPHMFTPNMDALAGRSAVFKNAHCQVALCGPSRTSFLTSRRPHTTSVFTNGDHFRNTSNPNIVTLPQLFKINGYKTLGAGKIFHGDVQDYPSSWEEPIFQPPNGSFWRKSVSNYIATEKEITKNPLPDTEIADYAIKTLTSIAAKAKSGEQPFFLAIGFLKPHLSFLCPKRLLKHYPMEEVSTADNEFAPHGFPGDAWYDSAEFARLPDIKELGFKGEINETLPDEKAREIRRSYYCTVSHVDEELGRVLSTLKELGLEESTVVTFGGDHGWQLGEHSQWGKQTNFYLSTRTPLMIHVPGISKGTTVVNDLVEFVDLMPTLAEAAGLPTISACPQSRPSDVDLCTEGTSLVPLLKETTKGGSDRQSWKRTNGVAYTQYLHGNHRGDGSGLKMEYGVYDERFHFTKVVDNKGEPGFLPDWDKGKGDQLYDTHFDPDENVNVADKTGYKEIRERMESLLQKGFP